MAFILEMRKTRPTQRGQLTCPRLHSQLAAEPGARSPGVLILLGQCSSYQTQLPLIHLYPLSPSLLLFLIMNHKGNLKLMIFIKLFPALTF